MKQLVENDVMNQFVWLRIYPVLIGVFTVQSETVIGVCTVHSGTVIGVCTVYSAE